MMKLVVFGLAFVAGLQIAACGPSGKSFGTSDDTCGFGKPTPVLVASGVYEKVGLDPKRPPMLFGFGARAVVDEKTVELSFTPAGSDRLVRLTYDIAGRHVAE